jgi:hypothetical protein
MNPDYSLADWVSNRGTLSARKPLRAPGPISGGSHCRPKLNLSVARFSGLGSEVCVPNLHIAHFSEGGRRRISCSSSDFQSGILIAVVFSAT